MAARVMLRPLVKRHILPALSPAVMSSDQTSDNTTTDNKGKGPAKKNSEVRKEQNRIASRNYRESKSTLTEMWLSYTLGADPTPVVGEKRRQKLALLDEILKTEDSSEQSINGEPPESDGGGSTAGGSGWQLNNAHVPADESFTQGFNHAPSEWDAWLPPAAETSGQQPEMVLLGTVPDQTWTQFAGLEMGDQLIAAPGAFGNLTNTPNVPNEAFPTSAWAPASTSVGEPSTASTMSGFHAPVDETCAAVFNDRDLACIINRVRNLSPSQKWALISLLQQDANYPQGANPMHFRRQADSS